MKNLFKLVSTKMLLFAIAFASLIAVVPVSVSAASGYYVDYKDIASINVDKGASAVQALGVGSTYMYTAQVNPSDTKAILTKSNKNTGETILLKDSATGSQYVDYLYHANDMCLKSYNGKTNLFIATMAKNDHGLVRIEVDGDKFTKKGNYTFKINGKVAAITGIDIVSTTATHINFICKNGITFYRGSLPINATKGTVDLAYAFTLDVKNVVVNGKTVDLSSYVFQGFGYHNYNLYFPATKGNRSYIIVYNIKNATGTVKSDPKLSFRITSKAYANLFEIESCDIGSDGKLYFATNRRKTGSWTNYSGVHYIKDFQYSGQSAYNVTADMKNQLKNLLFDPVIYSESNRDVKNVYGTKPESLKSHWIEYGINEGRFASVFFDAKYYLANNKDIADKYGSKNYKAAYDHFVNTGFWEGRQGSQYFSAEVYITRNLDLAKAFGAMNYLRAAQHYLECGLKEIHRVTSMSFSVQKYYDRYGDLRNAFGKDGRSLIIHYHNNGKAEGRNAK